VKAGNFLHELIIYSINSRNGDHFLSPSNEVGSFCLVLSKTRRIAQHCGSVLVEDMDVGDGHLVPSEESGTCSLEVAVKSV